MDDLISLALFGLGVLAVVGVFLLIADAPPPSPQAKRKSPFLYDKDDPRYEAHQKKVFEQSMEFAAEEAKRYKRAVMPMFALLTVAVEKPELTRGGGGVHVSPFWSGGGLDAVTDAYIAWQKKHYQQSVDVSREHVLTFCSPRRLDSTYFLRVYRKDDETFCWHEFIEVR